MFLYVLDSANLTTLGQFLIDFRDDSRGRALTSILHPFETTDWTHKSGTQEASYSRRPPTLESDGSPILGKGFGEDLWALWTKLYAEKTKT